MNMENVEIIELLRVVLTDLRHIAVKIPDPERRALWAAGEVRAGEALLDKLAKSIELLPCATKEPEENHYSLTKITQRLYNLELLAADSERRVSGTISDITRRLRELESGK